MNKLLKYIERVMQVITVISGIWAIVELVKMNMHKSKLKEKAHEYLEGELALEGNMESPVNVYSEDLRHEQKKVAKLVLVTLLGALISLILNLINKERF